MVSGIFLKPKGFIDLASGAVEKFLAHVPKLMEIPGTMVQHTLGSLKESEPLLRSYLEAKSSRRTSEPRLQSCGPEVESCKPKCCEPEVRSCNPVVSKSPRKDCYDNSLTRRRRNKLTETKPQVNIFKRFRRESIVSAANKADNIENPNSAEAMKNNQDIRQPENFKIKECGDSDELKESLAEFLVCQNDPPPVNSNLKALIPIELNEGDKIDENEKNTEDSNKKLSRFKRFLYSLRIPETEILNFEPFVEHIHAKYHHDFEDIKNFDTYNLPSSNYIIEKLDKPIRLCEHCNDFVPNTDNINDDSVSDTKVDTNPNSDAEANSNPNATENVGATKETPNKKADEKDKTKENEYYK